MSKIERQVDEALERAAEEAELHAAQCVDPGTGCPFAIAQAIRALKGA